MLLLWKIKKNLCCLSIASLLLAFSSNYVFALKDPPISQEEVLQISREVNKVLGFLSNEKREEISETVGIINFELAKRLGTKELVHRMCELAEFTVRYLTPIAGQEVADRAVANLGKCFCSVIKARALKNYPQDIIKLQKIGIDFKGFKADSVVIRDGSAPIATSSLSSSDLDSYIPGMHLMIGDTECLIGFNDFAVPVMRTLKKQLRDDLSCLDSGESAKRLFKDQLEEKARKALPCGEGFELKPKKYRDIIADPHSTWEGFVPLYGFWVLYDTKKQIKKTNAEIGDFGDLV